MDLEKSVMGIEKLKEDNFHVWKLRIRVVLGIKGLNAHIEEEKVESDPKPKTTTWTIKDKKAMAIIGLSVSSDRLEQVQHAKTVGKCGCYCVISTKNKLF